MSASKAVSIRAFDRLEINHQRLIQEEKQFTQKSRQLLSGSVSSPGLTTFPLQGNAVGDVFLRRGVEPVPQAWGSTLSRMTLTRKMSPPPVFAVWEDV